MFRRFRGCDDPRFAHGGFGRGRHHWGRHRGGGRGGRLFDHGELRFVMLRLIAEKPRHGYEIIKAIEEQSGGAYSPSPGVVYPTLTLLEELGYITCDPGEGARKLYTITPEGRSFLDANRSALETVEARLSGAEAGGEGGSPWQVMRAMHNLKMALRLRLAQGGLAEDQLRRIAAVLDQAAAEIANPKDTTL